MASSSNIGLARLPWGKLPRSPVNGVHSSPLEVSFRDIMAEQQRESSQDKDFEKYIENSYVTVDEEDPEGAGLAGRDTPKNGNKSKSSGSGRHQQAKKPEVVAEVGKESQSQGEREQDEEDKDSIPDVERSFVQLEDLDKDKMVMIMSFYEDQDFEDASYELSEQELDSLADDDCDKYYEGLAKKLSTVVEIQASPVNTSYRGSRSGGGSLQHQANPDSLIDPPSQVMLGKLKQKGVLRGSQASGSYKVVNAGKRATVFHATGGMLKRREDIPLSTSATASMLKLRLPKECAVKVFKNTSDTCEDASIAGEEEQRQVEAMREMSYLNRMTRSKIPCPQVQFVHGHILVTEFLGKDGIPAKTLKDAKDLTSSRSALKSAYEQVTNNMKTLFKTCHLVHGDLSETNILWYKGQAYFMSVGAAVNSNRPAALELLYRDCLSITEFFEVKGKPGCRTPQQLFQWITGVDYTGELLHETCGSDFAIV